MGRFLTKLGRLRVARARAILLSTLEGNDERARLAAAEGLARLGDDSGRKAALAVLGSDASPNRELEIDFGVRSEINVAITVDGDVRVTTPPQAALVRLV